METKKNEDKKRKAGDDPSHSQKRAQQEGQLIIEQARKQANDEAAKILNMVEEKGRLIISDSVRFAETKAAQILAQARQEAHEILAKAPEQAQSHESKTVTPNREQIGQAREAQNVAIDSQLGTTMAQTVDKGFSIVMELTRKAESEADKIIAQAKDNGRQIIEEATKKRESEAEKIVSQARETGRQIIDEATRKAEEEGNKIVTQALQTGLNIIVEAARIADAEPEITRKISQGQQKEGRLFEEAKAAALSRLSTDQKYSDVDHEVQLPEEKKNTIFTKVLAHQKFAGNLLKSRPKTEKEKTAATPRLKIPKSILKLGKEKTAPQVKVEVANQTAIYEGRVELTIMPPIDVIQLKKLRTCLQRLKNVRILSTGGRADGTTLISVLLNRPCHLITDLIEIEAVEEASGEENLDSHPLSESLKKTLRSSSSKRTNHRKILLKLKKTEPVMSPK